MNINEDTSTLNLSGFTTNDPSDFISSLVESFNISMNDETPQVILNRENMIYQEGTYIKDCSFLVTPEICQECMYNSYLIENAVILEGAKLDLTLKNFLREGKDYRGLKRNVQAIVEAFDLDDKKIKTGRDSICHYMKRSLQICADLETLIGAPFNSAMGLAMADSVVYGIIGGIIGLIVSFIISRLLRLLWDMIEFKAVEKDVNNVIKQLKEMERNTKDKNLKKKCKEAINKLQSNLDKCYDKTKKQEDNNKKKD